MGPGKYGDKLLPRRLRVGLLGGSFNPAHAGHVHISREALRRLNIDEVWWLVSPRNPLKQEKELESYEARFARACQAARGEPRIRVSNLEQHLGTRYTVDALQALKHRCPRVTFIWLMGADNLQGFHHWRQWERIFQLAPVAVFDRAPHSHRCLRAKAGLRFTQQRQFPRQLHAAPGWAYVPIRRRAESGTALRQASGH